MPVLPDLTPLRVNPDYRRLYLGFACSGIGSQMANVAIGLQVYRLTSSTAAVGLVGIFALVPLVVMGLYGGSLADHHDRRTVALVAQTVAWLTSLVCAVQAVVGGSLLGGRQVWLLYLVAALWSGTFAVVSPARSSIYPRILPLEQLPAANALSVFAMNATMTAGPLLAGFLVDWVGFVGAYTGDVLLTTAALWGLLRLPPVPPGAHDPDDDPTGDGAGGRSSAGLRSVWDGLRFLADKPNVRMTFVVDICAMVLAAPSVLLPAAGSVILGGGARTVGALYAAAALGGVLAMLASGPLTTVRRQGAVIMIAICGWGAGIVGLGLALLGAGGLLTPRQAMAGALAGMAVAGASDAVSAMFRTTILQSAAPDRMRGRLQGVFIVVVAGGPRLGDLLGGTVADRLGEGRTAVLGGLACIASMGVLAAVQRGFVHYDARHPAP